MANIRIAILTLKRVLQRSHTAAFALGLFGIGCAAQQHQSPRSQALFTPTAVEMQTAASLAERALAERNLRTGSPLYLVATELYRDKEAEMAGTNERQILVTHYRYDGDLGIQTIVNLDRRQVTKVETIPHLAVPLAPEELTKAKDLALANTQVIRALEQYQGRFVVQGLIMRTMSQSDPLFGHRVVRLLFRVGRDYLRRPVVVVDLTERKVTVEEPSGEPGHEMNR